MHSHSISCKGSHEQVVELPRAQSTSELKSAAQGSETSAAGKMDSDNETEDEYNNGEGQEMNGGEGEEIAANANGAQPRDVGSQYDDYGKDVLERQ